MSPVRFSGDFQLIGIPEKQFFMLGAEQGNKGTLHTVFLSKPVGNLFLTAQEPVKLNGFCKYAFLQDPGGICGFVIISPMAQTKVKNVCVVVGSEAEKYRTHFHLEPQGVLVLESTDSNTLFIALNVESSLLVKVDL